MGARPLRRAIQRYVEDPLADEVLKQGEMRSGSTVMVDRDQDGDDEHPLKLTIIPPTTPPKSKDDEEEPPKVGVTADKGEDDEGSDEPSPDEPSGDGKSGE